MTHDVLPFYIIGKKKALGMLMDHASDLYSLSELINSPSLSKWPCSYFVRLQIVSNSCYSLKILKTEKALHKSMSKLRYCPLLITVFSCTLWGAFFNCPSESLVCLQISYLARHWLPARESLVLRVPQMMSQPCASPDMSCDSICSCADSSRKWLVTPMNTHVQKHASI